MKSAHNSLSDDPVELKEIILNQQRHINQLEEFIRLQKHRQFGAVPVVKKIQGFVEAQKATASPKGKKARVGRADVAINLIGKLYAIERQIKDKSEKGRYETRQRDSLPVLKALRIWLDKTVHNVLPKGVLGKALGCLDKNWDKLTVYTEQGSLNIDNNPAENAIRPFVIGRKNWLFNDTQKGAKASALLYSIIETAKANGLEPFVYLSRVFKELPSAQSLEEIEALLPWRIELGTVEDSVSQA